MKVRIITILSGLLIFLQLHCGGTSGDTFSPSGVSSGETSSSPATNSSEVNTSKGVFIEGDVRVPTQVSLSSKSIESSKPAKEGVVCCKRYDGVTVANGSVNALGEIAGTVVPPASLDATEQIICEIELEDGKRLLNHYDLTDKVEGDRVRVDVSDTSTTAVEQVLSACGSAVTFKNMEACTPPLNKKDFDPRKLFEKYRDKIEGDTYTKTLEPVKAVVSEEEAKKYFELVLQTPYGLDKTRDRSEQGNLGRPLMGDPYGKDKDTSLKGKERGRPFHYKPPPEPPPPEPPPVILESPVNPLLGFSVMSSGWDLAITPQTLGGERYQSFSRSVSWSYVTDPDIAGFHIYDKTPGESAFRLLQTIDLSKVVWYSTTYGRDSVTGAVFQPSSSTTNLINVWSPGSGGTRVANQWPLGIYESYIVAYDANGKEGPSSAIASAVNLGEIQWLRPTEGQILETYLPAFQWSNIWPEEVQASGWSYPNNWGWTELIVSEQGAIYNIFHSNVGWFTTFWKGPTLTSGHQYYLVVNTGGFTTTNGVKRSYLAYSRLVGFSAQ